MWLNSSTRIWRKITYIARKEGAPVKIYMLTYPYHPLLGACINYYSLWWNISSLPLVAILYFCHHLFYLSFSLSLSSPDKKFTTVGRICSLLLVVTARFRSGNVKFKKRIASSVTTASTGSHALVKLFVYIMSIYRSKLEWKPET